MTEKEIKWYHKKYDYERDDDGVRIYKTSYWKLASGVALSLGSILMALSICLIIGWNVNAGVPVRREFSNYINSADDMYDPHLVIQTLEQARQGIEDLGLKPTDNAAIFPWDKNYRHTPQFALDQIASVIDYAESFIEWKEQSYSTGVIEVAADVYADKMGNLRKIADDISINPVAIAYCLNTPGCLWYAYDFTLFMTGLLTLLAGVIFHALSSEP